MYRKEHCLSLLKDPEEGEMENDEGEEMERVLWAIKDLDTKWLLLQRWRRAFISNYNQRDEEVHRTYDEARLNLNKQIFKSILKSIRNAESERIPFIAMYRKEQCLSLLKDPEEGEMENDEGEEMERVPKLKWHKVGALVSLLQP
uniref:Uncharacterized protein n=1 Tax=Quercus lobata TaxID=97700 RepID=A0A7N2QWY4_QUELO